MRFAVLFLSLFVVLALPTAIGTGTAGARAGSCHKPAGAKVFRHNREAVIFNQTRKPRGQLEGFVLSGCSSGVGRMRELWSCDQGQFTEFMLQELSLRGSKVTLEAELLTEENYDSGKLIHLTRTVNLRTGEHSSQRSQPRPEPPGLNYLYDCPADLANGVPI